LAGAGAAVLLLAGCNPESAQPTIGTDFSVAKFQYDGPADAWFEAAVSDVDGYQVEVRGAVYVPDYVTNSERRECRDGVDREVVETCDPTSSYPEFPYTDSHAAVPDAYWPMVHLHPGEQFQVAVHCKSAGATVACPAATTVHVQTVDGSGELVGDIKPLSRFGPA
jgi:hypothetical protein